jgi:hypothetical protein
MERDFKGVWIPKEVWLDTRLNALDKIILVEIDSLDCGEGCFASNKYLADFCQCSEIKISKSVSLLIELGYLEVIKFDGRKRFLKSCLIKNIRQTYKKYKADLYKIKDNNINNNIDNKNNIDKSILLEKSETYGNQEINEMFDKWKEMFGYKPKNSKQNRFALYNMLRAKDKGKDWIIQTMVILREAQKDKYAGAVILNIADFYTLQQRCDIIWKWGSGKALRNNISKSSVEI